MDHACLVMAFPAELVCSLPPSRVKELGARGNGRVAPRPAKPSQHQSPTDEDSLYQEEEEEEEEEEVGVGAEQSLPQPVVHLCACPVHPALLHPSVSSTPSFSIPNFRHCLLHLSRCNSSRRTATQTQMRQNSCHV